MTLIKQVKILILSLLVVAPFILEAQPDVDFQRYSKKYPDSRGAMLDNNRSAKLTVKNNKLQIEITETKSYFITTDKPNYFSEGTIYFSETMKINSFEAYSLIPEGKKYKKVKVEKFQDSFDSDDNIFYDESKKRTFLFPSLVQGAKVFQEHSILIDEPRYFGKFFFESFLPVENSVFEMIVPNGVEFTAYKLGNRTENIQYTQQKDGKNTIHRWVMTDLKPLVSQENAMPMGYYSPHLVIVINRYKDNDGKIVEVTPDLQSLYKWYVSLIAKVDLSISPEIKQITDSITKDIHSDFDKLKSIYYWVQDNIKYIAFEHGMEGIVPREPQKVMAKRYGDCKDMAMLIHIMAKSAGVKAYPTWIGTRDIPYRYDQFPSMNVDNHMIITYLDSLNKPYFVDGTSQNLDINRPSSFIQGKQALVYYSDTEYKLLTVPEVDASENYANDSVVFHIVNDSLVGEGTMRLNGYLRQMYSNRLRGLSGDNLAYTLEVLTKKGNNKYKLDTAYFNTLDRDSVLIIHYRFTIKDYITINGDEIFVNLNLDKDLKNTKIEIEQSPYPIYQSTKIMWNARFILEIPDGYQVDFIPQNYNLENNYVGVVGEYTKTAKTIGIYNHGKLNYLELPVTEFVNYNSLIKKVNQAYNQSISLKKIKK
jgi:hypothetical protein